MFGFKKTLLENFLKSHFDKYIRDGRLEVEEFDTDSRKCSVSALLVGEDSPIRIEVSRYEVIQGDGDSAHLRLKEVKSNREWVEIALNEYVVDVDFPIPPMVAAMI